MGERDLPDGFHFVSARPFIIDQTFDSLSSYPLSASLVDIFRRSTSSLSWKSSSVVKLLRYFGDDCYDAFQFWGESLEEDLSLSYYMESVGRREPGMEIEVSRDTALGIYAPETELIVFIAKDILASPHLSTVTISQLHDLTYSVNDSMIDYDAVVLDIKQRVRRTAGKVIPCSY